MTTLPTLILVAITVSSNLVAVISAYYALKNRLELLHASIEGHQESIKQHDSKIAGYEVQIVKVIGDLQRLIGRFETFELLTHERSKSKG